MKFKKFAATSALVIAAMGVAAGTAYAEPATTPASNETLQTDILPGIHYKASIVDHSVVITTDAGSLATKDGQFEIADNTGKLVAGVPLSYQRDGQDHPIDATIDGNTATLTPSTDPARATAAKTPGVRDVDATANANFNQALSNLGNEVSISIAIGTLLGTTIGAAVGCVLGGVVGATAGTAFSLGALAVPGALGGCLVTAAVFAPLGAIAGTLIIGGPVVAVGLFQFFNDLNTPPAPAPAPAS